MPIPHLYCVHVYHIQVMCKPKIMPIKSVRMQKLEELIEKATAPPEEKEEEEEEKDAR